jgi:hypothetical protein
LRSIVKRAASVSRPGDVRAELAALTLKDCRAMATQALAAPRAVEARAAASRLVRERMARALR